MTGLAPYVFVVDDDESVRTALGRLLKAAGFRVEVFAAAEEFLAQPAPDAPACVVLDVLLPGLGGLDLQRALAGRPAPPSIVFISGYGDVPTSVGAMKGGARDFLSKPVREEDLLAAVREAIAEHAQARRAEAEADAIRRLADALSPREREVMALVVTGLPNKLVGRRLGVGEKTIKVHRARVMRKMHARSLVELVKLAEKVQGPPPAPLPAPALR